MVWYIVRKYLLWTVVFSGAIAALWLLSPLPKSGNLTFKSIFWGGVVATILTYQIFKRDNLWVLYANLRLSPILLLGLLFGSVQILNVILLWLLRR